MSNMNVQPVAPGYYPPPPARRSGCLVALVVILMILLGLSVLVNLALMAKSGGGMGPGGTHRSERLAQKYVRGSGDVKVALIELEGVIADEVPAAGIFGIRTKPVERIRRELEEAAEDDSVKAVLFAVNSPGGTITASDDIAHLFRQFQEKTKKKVIVHMGSLAASGGYYVSAGADEILASPTTITGSIGVILQTFNFSEAMDKFFKVQNVTIKSGANKDLLNPFQPINEEHVRILQNMIDQAYDKFVGIVSAGRKIELADVKKLADGRIYTADEALKLKLIDKIGYLEDALDEAKRLTGATDVTLFRYTRPPSVLEALAGDVETRVPEPASRVDALAAAAATTPRICYLWSPGLIEMAGCK